MEEMTKKAQSEVEKLIEEMKSFHQEKQLYLDKMASESNWKVRDTLRKEMNRIVDKIWKKEEKVRVLRNSGISTSERTSLAKEAWDKFTTVEQEKSLGCMDYTKVGQSKVLDGQFVKVRMVRWSGFMSNVKGCGSLANKKEMSSFTVITKEEYEALINKGTKTVTVSFMGTETKEVPLSIR